MTTAHMWEATVAPGRLDEAVAWVRDVLLVEAGRRGAERAEGFSAEGDPPRVVAITWWPASSPWSAPEAPEGLLTRAHGWIFDPITSP